MKDEENNKLREALGAMLFLVGEGFLVQPVSKPKDSTVAQQLITRVILKEAERIFISSGENKFTEAVEKAQTQY
jgi:hypothetical protein